MNPIESIKEYVRAANYLAAAQIYLADNFLLKKPLKFEHIKPRLLGHWGTSPGINFVYGHLQHFVKRHSVSTLFVLGPGHGFPALQANLFIEETLGKYYPQALPTEAGVGYIAKQFSWPYGFPSHSNPGTPGVIVEGGELGYALSTAYGSVLDNPDLLTVCLVGDGEAETAATATGWHLHKFINPASNGAVLPILHLNGYKISGPTIFGRMSNKDLKNLFSGYGYEPIIVEGRDVYQKMFTALDHAYEVITRIQHAARNHTMTAEARFPMIIMKTPKGWTGIKTLHGKKIEGNCLSHQVTAPLAKTDPEELKALSTWLRSYHFENLFDSEKGFSESIRSILPAPSLRIGQNRHAYAGTIRKDLILPEIDHFNEEADPPGIVGSSSMRRAGLYLNEVFALNANQKNFRFFSPDETYSNKLDAIFSTTPRSFELLIEPWDMDLASDGRVIEMLSEHSLQGLAQGYILTGRHAVFASYEAFIQVVSSMADQYAKFLKVAREIPWRGAAPSFNYILTSSGWRQEHNGFSHQNPGFVSDMLERQGCFIRIFFPPDGTSTLVTLRECLASTNRINVIVAGKTLEPRWLNKQEAEEELTRGLMIWKFASDENPDIVFAAVGDYLTKESLAGIQLLREELPIIRIRFVNILELTALGLGNDECRVPFHDFNDYFTPDKPIIVNYHGYPDTVKPLFFDKGDHTRFVIKGYIENGSTTTPFDMQIRNRTSRYHLVQDACTLLAQYGTITKETADAIRAKYDKKIEDHGAFIRAHGIDPEEIEQWQWNTHRSS
ncbi:MAG: phosphoketolase family protein [Patescibacteria group bacterium]|nr:phosphoketolase family protein [Patescibacteria group bacterium]MDE2438198.1 phosphoketolase family protein [Patescibacteria group bacterium]